jgi:predicted nucleotidyltransferase
MNERDREIISELKHRLTDDILPHLKKLIVFGSRVRGEAAEDSDIDILVVITEKNPDIEKKLEDIAYSVMWDYDFKPIISIKTTSESHFNESLARGFSFYRHVEKEGISV